MKSSTEKQKQREFSKPALQQMLKDHLQTGNRENVYKLKSKTTKNMAMGSYLPTITLNVNVLNDQPKEKDWLNGYKNKTPIYAVYERPTSNQGTHTD